MVTDFIHPEHLVFLLNSLSKSRGGKIPDQRIQELVHKTQVLDQRREVLKFLDTQSPGTMARLADMWFFSGRRTVNLWELPIFVNDENPISIFERFDKRARPGAWTDVDSGQAGEDRVVAVLANNAQGLALARVILNGARSYTDIHGHRQQERYSYPIQLSIDFKFKHPLLEVPAAIQSARKATFTFFDWLFDWKVPRRKSKEQEEYLKPVVFTEAQIWRLAEQRGFENVVIDGIDPSADVGERQLRGKLVGNRRQKLNSTTKIVREQQRSQNDMCAFNVPFDHTDNYHEVAEVAFNFASSPPHITFNRGATKPVVDYLLEQVYTWVGQGTLR